MDHFGATLSAYLATPAATATAHGHGLCHGPQPTAWPRPRPRHGHGHGSATAACMYIYIYIYVDTWDRDTSHPCGRNAWEIPSTDGMEDFCRPINRSIDRQIHSSKTWEIERMIDRGIDPLIDHSIDRPPHRPLERSTARSISIRPTAGLVG